MIAGSLIMQWQIIWSIHARWKPDLKLLESGELGLMVFMSSFIAVFVRAYENDELRSRAREAAHRHGKKYSFAMRGL